MEMNFNTIAKSIMEEAGHEWTPCQAEVTEETLEQHKDILRKAMAKGYETCKEDIEEFEKYLKRTKQDDVILKFIGFIEQDMSYSEKEYEEEYGSCEYRYDFGGLIEYFLEHIDEWQEDNYEELIW